MRFCNNLVVIVAVILLFNLQMGFGRNLKKMKKKSKEKMIFPPKELFSSKNFFDHKAVFALAKFTR